MCDIIALAKAWASLTCHLSPDLVQTSNSVLPFQFYLESFDYKAMPGMVSMKAESECQARLGSDEGAKLISK